MLPTLLTYTVPALFALAIAARFGFGPFALLGWVLRKLS